MTRANSESLERLKHDLTELENGPSALGARLKMLHGFNIFRVLKLDGLEIRHSNMLGWLLDPGENHGLGETFLAKFFTSVECLRGLSLTSDELKTFSVFREADHKDIELRSDAAKVIVVIENKWNAAERESDGDKKGQLKTYRDTIEENPDYDDWSKFYLFLTPTGTLPSEENLDEWEPISYSVVIKAIESAMADTGSTGNANSGPRELISHYLAVLKTKGDIMCMDEDLASECVAFYKRHKEAFDLVNDVLKKRKDMSDKGTAYRIANEAIDGKRKKDPRVISVPPNPGNNCPSFHTSLMDNVIPQLEQGSGSWSNSTANYYYWFEVLEAKVADQITMRLHFEFGGITLAETSPVIKRMEDIAGSMGKNFRLHRGNKRQRFQRVWGKNSNRGFSMDNAEDREALMKWAEDAIDEALANERKVIAPLAGGNGASHWQSLAADPDFGKVLALYDGKGAKP